MLLRVWQGSALAFSVVLFYITIRAVFKNNKDAKRLLVGILFLVFTAIWDILGASGMIPIQNLNLSRFGFLFFVLGIAVVLANRFLRVHKQVEELNANLERKVVERTNELQETLTRVQELKVQQDGDYFLTSLLLDPLNDSKKSHSAMIGIQSYTKQKKEFEFKGKTKEIGGDLIICDDIVLNGKKYFVFINGDAMGKSIQGAGGALVLGVVFLSFIRRTQVVLESQSKSPERWIKECFLNSKLFLNPLMDLCLFPLSLDLWKRKQAYFIISTQNIHGLFCIGMELLLLSKMSWNFVKLEPKGWQVKFGLGFLF